MREKYKKHPHNQYFLVRGACFYHEKVRILNYKGVRTKVLCYFEFYRTAITYNNAAYTQIISSHRLEGGKDAAVPDDFIPYFHCRTKYCL